MAATIIWRKALDLLAGRRAPRPRAHLRLLRRRLKIALARRKAGHEIDQLVPGAQHDAERPRHGVAAEGDLLYLVGDIPVGAPGGGKKDHIAGAEPALDALVVGDKSLARDDVERFVN